MSSTRTGPDTISLLTPRVEPGSQRLAAQRPAQPVGRDAARGPAEGDQREHGTGLLRAAPPPSPAWIGDGARGSDARVEVQRREARRRQQHELGEVVIEARAAAAADDGDAVAPSASAYSSASSRSVASLSTGWRSIAHARGLGGAHGMRRSPSRGRRRARRRSSPSDAACSSPESAAITNAPAGSGPTSAASGARPPLTTRARPMPAAAMATPRGECARIASCAWSRSEICCSTWSCASRRRPRRTTTSRRRSRSCRAARRRTSRPGCAALGARGAPRSRAAPMTRPGG